MVITAIEGACAWLGRDLVRSDRWIRHLSADHIDGLDTALAAVDSRGLAWHEITAADFAVPALAGLVAEIRGELETGSGLMKLSGLPVDRYSEKQLRRLYFGLGVNIGTPVHQNRRGELMRFIRDEGVDVGVKYGQIEGASMAGGKTFLSSYARTLTNGPLRFHTDRTDVVSLLCVNQAGSGGLSTVCSSVSVMNEMLHRRPDLVDVLFEPYFRSRHGEEADEADDVYPLPIFGVRDGASTSHFSLTYIEAAQVADGVPKLTSDQSEAIDLLLELAKELSFEMTLEPGDIQFLNSHVTYHGRTGFQDSEEDGRSRLLMRLWLSMPNSRSLPDGHDILWGSVDAGVRRGGIGQASAV